MQVLKLTDGLGAGYLLKGGSPVDPAEIRTEEFQQILRNMYDVCDTSGGTGLAAPQIGIDKRVFVFKHNGEFTAVINPVYIKRKGMVSSYESCLSIPGETFKVKRHKLIILEYIDKNGNVQRLVSPTKKVAFCLQHEMDHLDGVLINAKGK